MAETCVLGHAWTPGRVLCAVCGFGPRALQPGQVAAVAAQAAAVTSEPELAVTSARTGRSLQLDEPAAVVSPVVPAEPELTLSPDGQWAWNGTEWVPAPPQPEAAPQADLMPEPAPRRTRRRRGKDKPEAAAVGATPVAEPTVTPTAKRRAVDPKLLIGLVAVLAVAAAADYALHEPPLGHKTATVSSAPVPSASQNLAREAAFTHAVLTQGATAERAYRAKSGLYTSSVAQLRKAGMPAVGGAATFVAQAHHGTGFCLAAGAQATGHRFSLYDSVKGGIRPTVYPTEAAALKGCSQHS